MLQVTLPDELGEWVQSQAASSGLNPNDYLIGVVRSLREQSRRRASLAAELEGQAESVLAAIEEEGEDIRATPQWWDEFQAEMEEKHGRK